MKPRSPAEQWRAVELTALGPEARELEELSDEELDAELRASGLDPEQVGREGQAAAERALAAQGDIPPPAQSGPALPGASRAPELVSTAVEALPAEPPPAGGEVVVVRRWGRRGLAAFLVPMAATLAIVGMGAALYVATREPPPPPRQPIPDEPLTPPERPMRERVAELRHAAQVDCDEHVWRRCLERLDRAGALDPAGEADPGVQALRALATDALRPRDAEVDDRKKGQKGPDTRSRAP